MSGRSHWGTRTIVLVAALAALACAATAAEEPPIANVHWRVPECQILTYDVHAFFYSWYGNPKTDGHWIHWDHQYLSEEKTRGRHKPDEGDLGSPYYPALGPYSSSDPATVREQLKQLKCAGIGTISYSWWGRGKADGQGGYTDKPLNMTLRVAEEEGVQVNLHLEPYTGRSTSSIREDLRYIMENYAWSPALQRVDGKPVLYVYDSYHIPYDDWRKMLLPQGPQTVRGTALDGFFIGLVVNPQDDAQVPESGFDASYSYFATDGFSYGSTTRHWRRFVEEAAARGAMFVPSIGPGYDDLEIRTWNGVNYRDRDDGRYYDALFEAALAARPRWLTVTSFNEVGEGTQIEAAVPMRTAARTYKDYGAGGPDFYLRKTRAFVERFLEARAQWYPSLYGQSNAITDEL